LNQKQWQVRIAYIRLSRRGIDRYLPGTIPKGQNNPRSVRFGLYAEQMTGSSFVAPRHLNKKVGYLRRRMDIVADASIRRTYIGRVRPLRIKDL
jgi:homogentisate 1,2-dioxygenase